MKRAMGVTLLFECLRMAFQQPLLSEKIHSTLISILENGWANTGGSAELRQSKKSPAPPVSLLERNLLEILVMLFCILPKEVRVILLYSDYAAASPVLWMVVQRTHIQYVCTPMECVMTRVFLPYLGMAFSINNNVCGTWSSSVPFSQITTTEGYGLRNGLVAF